MYIAIMALPFRLILFFGFLFLFTENCSSSKTLYKRILITHHAVCNSYTSAMGKGHGIKLTIALNEAEIKKNNLTIDSLFIQNKPVLFNKDVKDKEVILEYSNYYQQAEPYLNADGSIQMEKKTTNEITATNLTPTYILLHNNNHSFRLDIIQFSFSKN